MVLTLTITNPGGLLPLSVGLEEQGWAFVALKTGKFKVIMMPTLGATVVGLSDRSPQYGM